jgi:hypothetical protein
MVPLIGLGLGILQLLLQKLGPGTPAEVVAAIQNAYNALLAHQNDLITKANFDAQRG